MVVVIIVVVVVVVVCQQKNKKKMVTQKPTTFVNKKAQEMEPQHGELAVAVDEVEVQSDEEEQGRIEWHSRSHQ